MPLTSAGRPPTIAIDGPAAAGKSTVARAVASRLGLSYVDTGAMYRSLTLSALETGVDPEDEAGLAALAARTRITFRPASEPGGAQRVELNGRDVTTAIRSVEVDRAVSAVSRHGAVRDWFREEQRALAGPGGVVMEGRDIGTVVLPDADVKVFLDANLDCRVRRRFRELQGRGFRPEAEQVRLDMERRDSIDANRDTAPLVAAPDALVIDTTDKSLERVIEEVIASCRERLGRGPR